MLLCQHIVTFYGINHIMKVEIKEFRKLNKITQQELAEKIGVTRSCISQYEIGAREPDLTTLMKIAYALNVTPDDLLDYETFKRKMDKNR